MIGGARAFFQGERHGTEFWNRAFQAPFVIALASASVWVCSGRYSSP